MQLGPPSSSELANASVAGLRREPSVVRQTGVSTSAVGGKLTSTARSPSGDTDASSAATDAGPVCPGTPLPTTRYVSSSACSVGARTSGPSTASASTRSIRWST